MIQDVDIPLERAAEFLAFLHRRIGIVPIWICPIRRPASAAGVHAVSRSRPARLYVNFGFWDVVSERAAHSARASSTG